jgi:hypothetical protein
MENIKKFEDWVIQEEMGSGDAVASCSNKKKKTKKAFKKMKWNSNIMAEKHNI